MTNSGFQKALKRKIILVLAFVAIISLSIFGLIACNDSHSNEVSDPTYSYTDPVNTALINNGNFSSGTADLKLDEYPKTSVSGWTKAADNGSKTSYVNSGAINVGTEGWKELASTLYDDVDYRNYLINKGVYKLEDVKAAIKATDAHASDPNYTPTDDEIKDYIVSNYIIPLNPGSHDADNHVYMLNNYATDTEYGLGTAQKLTASNSITVEQGKYGKVSVWVKTQNVNGINGNGDFGANIRIVNTLKSTTQAEFRVSNIKSTEWTNYIIYIKADSSYASTFTLVLGLGYGNGDTNDATNYTEGTVYFDDITYEVVDSIENVTVHSTNKLVYGADDPIEVKTGNTFVYDMTLSIPSDFFTSYALPTDYSNVAEESRHFYFTESNIQGVSGKQSSDTLVADSNVTTDGSSASSIKLQLNKASYTVKIDNNGTNFSLDGGNCCLLAFELKNSLSGFGSTTVTADVFDVYGNISEKRAAVATFSANDETTTYCVLIKNNYSAGTIREFYVNLIIGPADVGSVVYDSEFATGTVEISNLRARIGESPEDGDTYYDYFRFYQNSVSATVALYAGMTNDIEDNTTESETYSLNPTPSDIGSIVTMPTNPTGYYGITANHTYIIDNGNNVAVNTRSGAGYNGSFAGLINTKYLSNYSNIPGLETALNHSGDDIQPLMIYNNTADHYGYIGTSQTVNFDSYVNVSVTLRVTDVAKAYLYLIDTSSESKSVMKFTNFTVNTDVPGAVAKGEEINGDSLEFALVIDSSMMQADGWLTVNFYIHSGANSKNFRLEVWNGGRTNSSETASKGFVFIKDIQTTSTFTELERIEDAFSVSGNPLFDEKVSSFTTDDSKLIAYQRELTDLEEQFNKEYPDSAVSYLPKYVWAKNYKTVYAIYDAIEPTEVNPYDSIEDETNESGCTSTTDPSTFWLSFSSILLGVILVIAIIALFVKNYRRRHKVSKDDAKSHYKITSRAAIAKKAKNLARKKEEKEVEIEEPVVETQTEAGVVHDQVKPEEQDLDSYVYGDVQDFGNDEENESND